MDKLGELLEEFIFDSREHLETAGCQLLELEKDPSSLASLNALLGTLHTIKGNSGFVNQKRLYELLHAAESLLQTVRELPERFCPPTVVERIFQVLDTASAIMDRLESDEGEEVPWMPSLMEAIREASQSLEAGSAPAPPGEAPPREGPGGASARAPAPLDPREPIQFWAPRDGDLEKEGEAYALASAESLAGGAKGLVLDLRSLSWVSRGDSRCLARLRAAWGSKLVFLLSDDGQGALRRLLEIVLRREGPELSFCGDEREAAAALD